MFSRDGSLTKKKREQWAKEQEERQREKDWFPFGENNSPGGGNPTRKHEAIDYSMLPLSPLTHDRSCQQKQEQPHAATSPSAQTTAAAMQQQQHNNDNPKSPQQQPAAAFPPFAVPLPPEYWQNLPAMQAQYSYAYPPIPVPYHLIPPGAIPIPPPQNPSCSQDSSQPPLQNFMHYPYYWYADPNQNPLPITPTSPEKPRQLATAVVYPFPALQANVKTVDDAVQTTPSLKQLCSEERRPRTSSLDPAALEADFEAQIKQKLKAEEDERQRALEEEAQLAELARQQEAVQLDRERRQHDEELEKERERERMHQQILEALEKAKKDAELTRKAKLYRHVLEADPAQEKALLGDDGERILKEVDAIERQRQHDFQEIEAAAKSPRIRPEDRPLPSPFDRAGASRTSVRVTPTQKPATVARRSSSAERNRRPPASAPSPPKPQPPLHKSSTPKTTPRRPRTAPVPADTASTSTSDTTSPPAPLRPAASGIPPSTPSPGAVMIISAPSPPTEATKPSARPPKSPEFKKPQPRDPQTLLFGFAPIRRTKMRTSADEQDAALRGSLDSNDASSSDSVSPSPAQSQRSPSMPSISVNDSDAENRCNNKPDVYSITQTPISSLSRIAAKPQSALYSKRLRELGVHKDENIEKDVLSPDARRAAEKLSSNESLRTSMRSLNLAEHIANVKTRAESPSLSQFRSMRITANFELRTHDASAEDPKYRSLKLRKSSEKHCDVLSRLANMRNKLDNNSDLRPPSRLGSTSLRSSAASIVRQ